jgi:predicted ATPase
MQRLNGMPLAIELAAARLEALGVTQLQDRFDHSFDPLTGGDRMAAIASGHCGLELAACSARPSS